MGKKLTVRQKEINKAQRAIARAEQALTKAQRIEIPLRTAGLLATSYNTYSGTENLIKEVKDYIASGKRLSASFKYKVSVLSERNENFWTANIKFTTGAQAKRGKNKVALGTTISVKEAQKLSNRYADTKQASQEEYRVIRRYNAAINPIANASAMQYTPQELATMRSRKKVMKDRDISFGGDSTLINDLAYSANVDYAREFIEMLMNVMKDPFMFTEIESWYRANADLQRLLDGATGSYWYEDYCEARNIIIAFINELKTKFNKQLSDDTKEELDNFRDILDNQDDTY